MLPLTIWGTSQGGALMRKNLTPGWSWAIGRGSRSGQAQRVDGSQRCGQHHCEDGFPRHLEVFPLDQEELVLDSDRYPLVLALLPDNCTGRWHCELTDATVGWGFLWPYHMHPSEHLDAPGNVQAIIGAAISPTGRPGAYFDKDMETRISAIKSLSGAENLPMFFDGATPLRRSAPCAHFGGIKLYAKMSGYFEEFLGKYSAWSLRPNQRSKIDVPAKPFQLQNSLSTLLGGGFKCCLFWPLPGKMANLTICSNGLKPPTSLSLTHFASRKHLVVEAILGASLSEHWKKLRLLGLYGEWYTNHLLYKACDKPL